MKKIVTGILAHVDAGKTTLSESMLYSSGKIRSLGRVDNKDTFLDNYELEKARGITIFSKQAVMDFDDTRVILLDTPGHVDFSAEMERTLQVLDYAILVISGADGIQSHTRTLWELLESYDIPTFIFVNKMDQRGTSQSKVMDELTRELSDFCIAFGDLTEESHELIALSDEEAMSMYLESGSVEQDKVKELILLRKIFPVYFGSALRQEGTDDFFKGYVSNTLERQYELNFGARIFKISRDDQGNRLTHLKVTGGNLKVKDTISYDGIEEKVNQIRIYSGEKFEAVGQVTAGSICAVTGLTETKPGQGIGREDSSSSPHLAPVLSYQLILPEGIDIRQMLPKLREIEEEEPELRVLYNEVLETINIQVMGAVQLEILQSIIKDRFDLAVDFDHGEIVYKETIASTVEGVGHFEPLRHYSEVHLLMEPGERGSGLVYETDCSEDILAKNWQRLVMTHLYEKDHLGVLTGSHITDMKISLVTGRAHLKHTAGGDFREATHRAIRQGLMEADSILLEPYYRFRLNLPENLVGRAMTDIDQMRGQSTIESSDGERAILIGSAPVSTMQNYQKEVNAYSKGEGRLSIAIKGYDICHNPEEVIERIGYDPDRDINNPTGSVFCSGGSGYLVTWDEVKDHMHLESVLKPQNIESTIKEPVIRGTSEDFISLEEIDEIINRTAYSNQGNRGKWKGKRTAKESYYSSLDYKGPSLKRKTGDEYLLVDGYNIIHAWPELKVLADDNMDAARSKLMDILSNYQPIRKSKVMLVFDAYRVEGRKESVEDYHNIKVVFTGEAQTADHFIEKFAHAHKKDYRITVATSDGLQQIIIRGAGAELLSARDLLLMIEESEDQMGQDYLSKGTNESRLEDVLDNESIEKLNKLKS